MFVSWWSSAVHPVVSMLAHLFPCFLFQDLEFNFRADTGPNSSSTVDAVAAVSTIFKLETALCMLASFCKASLASHLVQICSTCTTLIHATADERQTEGERAGKRGERKRETRRDRCRKDTSLLPIGPKVVPFWGSYLEFYKGIPKKELLWGLWVMLKTLELECHPLLLKLPKKSMKNDPENDVTTGKFTQLYIMQSYRCAETDKDDGDSHDCDDDYYD